MAFGLVAITLCVGYLGYMHAMKENNQQLYEAIDSEGERYMRRKSSKWDWWHSQMYNVCVCVLQGLSELKAWLDLKKQTSQESSQCDPKRWTVYLLGLWWITYFPDVRI